MLSLWWRRRQDTMYGYFGLVALLWAVSMLFDFVGNPPFPMVYWLTFLLSLDHLTPVVTVFFALRYAGWRWPRTERCLWIYAVASVPAIYLEQLHFEENLHSWRFTSYPVIFCYLTILVIAAQRRPAVERTLLSLAAVFQGAVIMYEIVLENVLDTVGAFQYYAYHTLPLYLAIGWILTDRFVRSLNEYERLNFELEQRVAEKGRELERNYRRVQQMEQERAVIGERQRIMSDMHDGVGGQLISTLSLVEHGKTSPDEVAAALRECIDDLRLTIDSLEPTENDLLPVLGNLRYRLDRRLKAQGIDLNWQVREVPKLACLTPQNVLHVLRILQEAFTNVLKHAHASTVCVETGVDAPGRHAFIRIRDNGAGFAGDHTGYGLGNMQRRAKIIGGDLEIQSSPVGTTLNLLLPVG
jgi:signal transduction histidine kinase